MNKTSIIILSFDTIELTRLCSASIRAYTAAGSYEIIVIDNGSHDGSVEYLRAQADVRLIENKENRGFPAGCNQGMKAAAADSDLLLLNSDTIVTPHWLENLQAALHSADDIGAVSCVTNNCANFQSIPAQYETLEEMEAFAAQFNASDPARWFPWMTLVAFALLVRREAYEAVGGLDEAFSPGNYEDDDYSLRLRQAGWQLLLCEDTFIHHFGSASFRKGRTPAEEAAREKRYRALSARNRAKLVRKHHLPEAYKTKHAIVDVLPGDLPAGTRVLLANCALGYDLYLLKSRMPQVLPCGLTFDRAAVKIGAAPYPFVWAKGWKDAVAAVQKSFDALPDVAVLIGDMAAVPETERVVSGLRQAGVRKIWYRSGDDVYGCC